VPNHRTVLSIFQRVLAYSPSGSKFHYGLPLRFWNAPHTFCLHHSVNDFHDRRLHGLLKHHRCIYLVVCSRPHLSLVQLTKHWNNQEKIIPARPLGVEITRDKDARERHAEDRKDNPQSKSEKCNQCEG